MCFTPKNIAALGIFILTAINCFSQTKPVFKRQYKIGDTYRYKLILSEYNNGELSFTNISICELHTIDSNGKPYDQVRWLSKKVVRSKDTIDQTSIATSIRPYAISLAGFGIISMPPIEKAEMTEPIEDFNTFFVAISPSLYMMGRRFSRVGDSVSMGAPIKVNFSNGTTIPKGEDCLAMGIKIVDSTNAETHIRTSFLPPSKSCLSFVLSDMSVPVVNGWPNNFQTVTPLGDQRFDISYGREFFYINSRLSNIDGKIIQAEMYNQIDLKIKHNCDNAYNGCGTETSLLEVRKLSLQLLDSP